MAVIRCGTTHFYTYEGYQRFFDYPATGDPPGWHTPVLWVDGLDNLPGSGSLSWTRSQYLSMISSRLPVSSPVELDFTVEYDGAKDEAGTVHIRVAAVEPVAYTDLHLRVAVVESGLSYEGTVYDQILRNYFPDRLGIAFAVAQGDTFGYDQSFTIHIAGKDSRASWIAENCQVVVFVQDDGTREVLQAASGPVVTPVPGEVGALSSVLAGDAVRLEWSPVTADTAGQPLAVDAYRVYRDTAAAFTAGPVPLAVTADTVYLDRTGVVGDAGRNYFYRVSAVAGCKESVPSSSAGEFGRPVTAGK